MMTYHNSKNVLRGVITAIRDLNMFLNESSCWKIKQPFILRCKYYCHNKIPIFSWWYVIKKLCLYHRHALFFTQNIQWKTIHGWNFLWSNIKEIRTDLLMAQKTTLTHHGHLRCQQMLLDTGARQSLYQHKSAKTIPKNI